MGKAMLVACAVGLASLAASAGDPLSVTMLGPDGNDVAPAERATSTGSGEEILHFVHPAEQICSVAL